MLKSILAGAAALLLLSPAANAVPSIDFSIIPVRLPPMVSGGGVYCTSFVIDSKRQYLMTADHCMQGTPFYADIEGQPAEEIWHDTKLDIAVLHAPAINRRAALNPAAEGPDGAERVYAYGYPKGKELKRIKGEAVFGRIQFDDIHGRWMFMKPNIISGMSGGPIVNKSGNVVGIIQVALANAPLGGGRNIESVYAASKEYWEFSH